MLIKALHYITPHFTWKNFQGREQGQGCFQGKHLVNVTPRKSVITNPPPLSWGVFWDCYKTEQKPSYCKLSYKCARQLLTKQWEMNRLKLSYPICFVFNKLLTCLLLSVCSNFSPYVSEAFGSTSAKYSKWNESADDTNLGGIINSLDVLKMQFDLDKWKTWAEVSKRKFNKVAYIGRNASIVFNWEKCSFNNIAKEPLVVWGY